MTTVNAAFVGFGWFAEMLVTRVFADVPELEPGEDVEVTDADGTAHRYSVVGGTQVEKSRFPMEAVFAKSERPVLVLITCGGPWDPHRGYRDNFLVYARAA